MIGSVWGDQGVFRPRELGPPSLAARMPWRLDPVADVPDTVVEAGRVGALEVRAASTRGTSHRFDGVVRQDAVGVTELGGRYVLAAVADGVGAAADAHRGAQLAVRHALGYLAWALPGAAAVDLGHALRAADRAVREDGPEPGSRSTTLTVALVELGSAQHRYQVARVGDSPAFLLADGAFRPLFDPRVGEIVDPRTDSLPSPRRPAETAAGVLAAGQALVLASDGIGVPVQETEAGAYLATAWVEPPGPVAYLHQLQFDLRTFDDDRTAVVVWAVS
ncbi:MAG: SpoIIE family protein phosphatase [Actinophytocola sp.]|uniref:protein phosphatase 2C domain-containing protein n=1 Tax=Actinophytocola sp. TaxID=1872138 RepID=UPI0013224092|nr:protein phosphatase 2C domain-containing protein [Actinophytocola sp.]MPZ80023.1 SpoIIE family protein phosphatase [Actinophytocola sp.]